MVFKAWKLRGKVVSGGRKPSFLHKFLFDLLSLKGKKHCLMINSSFYCVAKHDNL